MIANHETGFLSSTRTSEHSGVVVNIILVICQFLKCINFLQLYLELVDSFNRCPVTSWSRHFYVSKQLKNIAKLKYLVHKRLRLTKSRNISEKKPEIINLLYIDSSALVLQIWHNSARRLSLKELVTDYLII